MAKTKSRSKSRSSKTKSKTYRTKSRSHKTKSRSHKTKSRSHKTKSRSHKFKARTQKSKSKSRSKSRSRSPSEAMKAQCKKEGKKYQKGFTRHSPYKRYVKYHCKSYPTLRMMTSSMKALPAPAAVPRLPAPYSFVAPAKPLALSAPKPMLALPYKPSAGLYTGKPAGFDAAYIPAAGAGAFASPVAAEGKGYPLSAPKPMLALPYKPSAGLYAGKPYSFKPPSFDAAYRPAAGKGMYASPDAAEGKGYPLEYKPLDAVYIDIPNVV